MDWRMNVLLLDILLFPFTLAGWLIRGVFGLIGGLIGMGVASRRKKKKGGR